MHRWVEDAARQQVTIQTAHSDLGKFGKQTGAAFGARHSWSGFQGKDYCLSVQQLDIFSGVKRFSNVSCSVNSLAIGAMTPKLSERFASDAQMRRSAWTLNFEHDSIPELGTTVGQTPNPALCTAPGPGSCVIRQKESWIGNVAFCRKASGNVGRGILERGEIAGHATGCRLRPALKLRRVTWSSAAHPRAFRAGLGSLLCDPRIRLGHRNMWRAPRGRSNGTAPQQRRPRGRSCRKRVFRSDVEFPAIVHQI
jgi:hypothetical protein